MSQLPSPPEGKRQEDGRWVIGPDMSQEKAGRNWLGLGVGAAFLATALFAGFLGGRATAPEFSFHQYAEGLARDKHCVPLLDWGVAKTEGQVLAANGPALIALREQGMKHAEASVVPIEIGGTTYYIGIVTWENCADG